MSREVPKIEWLNETQTGTTAIGSDTITAVADTSNIQTGMTVVGSGIPTGSVVLSTTASTVVIDQVATAAGTVSIEYKFIFEFNYPPIRDDQEELFPRKRTSTAISGQTQTSVDYFEARLELEFQFLTETDRVNLNSFNTTHAGFGREFRYYPDKDVASFFNYELSTFNFRYKKTTPKPLYSLRIRFRRVVT